MGVWVGEQKFHASHAIRYAPKKLQFKYHYRKRQTRGQGTEVNRFNNNLAELCLNHWCRLYKNSLAIKTKYMSTTISSQYHAHLS